jgi:hypothetical protein
MDSVLIFVRFYNFLFYCRFDCTTNGRTLRRDCSQLPSPLLTSIVLRIYNQLLHNNRRFLGNNQLRCLKKTSQQLSSLGAQASGLSNSSLPEFTVNQTASDVRVNIFCFSSLVFSLSDALLAPLVQRWARDHTHIFQRYSHPLKIARIRQYLHEGVEG